MEAILDKIKILIENSKSFGILLDSNPEEHELLLREVVRETVTSKDIPVISLPKTPERFKKKWSKILKEEKNFEFPQKTSIKIPKDKYKIKEVSYKEDEKNISFVIDLPQNELALEDLSLEKLPPETDALFCLFENENSLQNFEKHLNPPKRDKIVFIKADKKTLTGKIFDILKIFDPDIQKNKRAMTMLYTALHLETSNFSQKTTKDTFSLASLLTESDAETETAEIIKEKEKGTSSAQLVGRILARTYIDEVFGISWSFLNSRDLQKTNNTSISTTALYELLKNVQLFIPQQNLYVLLWQTAKGVKALITASENKSKDYLVPFAEKTDSKMQGRFFVVGPFFSFSEAEKNLRQSFKEEISNVLQDYVEDDSIIG